MLQLRSLIVNLIFARTLKICSIFKQDILSKPAEQHPQKPVFQILVGIFIIILFRVCSWVLNGINIKISFVKTPRMKNVTCET